MRLTIISALWCITLALGVVGPGARAHAQPASGEPIKIGAVISVTGPAAGLGVPERNVRHHTCYSINIGPRIHDMELKDIVDLMLRVNAGAYSFEAANPRHEHEWKLWKEIKVPSGKSIVPGVISHATVLVEHPELVAERIVRYASVVGRENVIAGADCGFASFAISKDSQEMQRDIVWYKLVSLVEGARLATKQLWGRS
jgi:5-methyltetrahydropteroyltriglutamate--homocysteine methyltransferase